MHCARDRARPEPSRQLRRPARRLFAAARSPTTSARGWCRGWSATRSARCSASRCSTLLPEALDDARAAGGVRHAARRHPACSSCSKSWCCCATATPTSARCTARRRRCVIIGDAFHNFIDGAIICTAVMTSVPLGINTAIAVAAHEIPQEVGDVAILLAAGYSRGRALLLNVVSGASGIVGALRRVRRRRGHPEHPALRAGVLGGQPALHRDVGSDSRPASRARSTPTRCARCC